MRSVNRILFLLALSLAVGCSPVPSKYLRQAESGVTLTSIQTTSNYYQGKIVILGGTIVEEEATPCPASLLPRRTPAPAAGGKAPLQSRSAVSGHRSAAGPNRPPSSCNQAAAAK